MTAEAGAETAAAVDVAAEEAAEDRARMTAAVLPKPSSCRVFPKTPKSSWPCPVRSAYSRS